MQAPWWWSKTETCRSDIRVYFNINFNVFFKLIKVHLSVSELYIYQKAGCKNKKKTTIVELFKKNPEFYSILFTITVCKRNFGRTASRVRWIHVSPSQNNSSKSILILRRPKFCKRPFILFLFPDKNFECISHISLMCYTFRPSYSPWLGLSNNVCGEYNL